MTQSVPCVVHLYHSPAVHVAQNHHIVPASWHGETVPQNLVHICATGHDLVHELLNLYVRFHGEVPWELEEHFGRQERTLAKQGWDNRPDPTHTPYTAAFMGGPHDSQSEH